VIVRWQLAPPHIHTYVHPPCLSIAEEPSNRGAKSEQWMHRMPAFLARLVSVERRPRFPWSLVRWSGAGSRTGITDQPHRPRATAEYGDKSSRNRCDRRVRTYRRPATWTIRLMDRNRLASAPHLRLFIALPYPAPRAYPPDASSIRTAQSLPEWSSGGFERHAIHSCQPIGIFEFFFSIIMQLSKNTIFNLRFTRIFLSQLLLIKII